MLFQPELVELWTAESDSKQPQVSLLMMRMRMIMMVVFLFRMAKGRGLCCFIKYGKKETNRWRL